MGLTFPVVFLTLVALVLGSFRIEFGDSFFTWAAPGSESNGPEAYDFVFDVKSIADLTGGEGWALHIRNWTQGANILNREFQGSITSVLGMYNRYVRHDRILWYECLTQEQGEKLGFSIVSPALVLTAG